MQTVTQRVSRTGDPDRDERQTSAGWLALILFFFLAGIGVIAGLAVIAVYTSLATGLHPVSNMEDYQLPEETIVFDRDGAELARFGDFKRELASFEELPPILLDATTAIEDKTFWENAGFDPVAIVAAGVDSLRGSGRGASTVTQQLTRMRLLDGDLLEDRDRLAERKLKEIIQSIRLTQAYPGEAGKQQIITAYLNQIYYGNQSYGVKAAALSYFGVEDLDELTVAQAAILAALPKSPSNYDLVRNAVAECLEPADEEGECGESQLVVPSDTTVVQRRNQILELMAEGDRTPRSGDQYSRQDFLDAIEEPVVLVPQTTARWKAPHFIWRVRDELATKVCGEDSTCPQLDQGGLRVTTTIDSRIQGIAEKWVKAATIVPRQDDIEAAAERLDLPYGEWMSNLADKRLRNGAIVALDYQTGEVIAYVGSADYYATNSTSRFQPKYDVAGEGYRQPGSAFKPFNYAIGIDSKAMTAATVLMDVGTDFGNDFAPNNADQLERGPVRVRSALQFSLNIPAVKAIAINEPANVFARAQDFGMRFRGDASQAGLSTALGTQETPPIDLVTAFGTLANGGRYIGHTTILSVTDRDGDPLMDPYEPPAGEQVVSPQAAFIVTDILNGNTLRRVNPYWGEFFIQGPEDKRRPATLKTGTNNDAKDLNAYGYIAAPTRAQREDGAYALAVGAWNGNSDNTEVSTPDNPLFSIDVTTYVWQGFLTEASADWPVRSFSPPEEGLVQATIDPFTGFLAGSGQEGVEEWFISGTEPTARFPSDVCGPEALTELGYEDRFETWLEADRDWIERARRGPGTTGGPRDTQVSYFYNNGFNPFGRSWGPLLGRGCGDPTPAPTCFPVPSPDASGVLPSFTLPSADPSGAPVVACSPPPRASEEPSLPPSEPPSPTPEPVTPPPITPPPVTPPPITPPPVTPPPVTPAPSAEPVVASPAPEVVPQD